MSKSTHAPTASSSPRGATAQPLRTWKVYELRNDVLTEGTDERGGSTVKHEGAARIYIGTVEARSNSGARHKARAKWATIRVSVSGKPEPLGVSGGR